MITRKTETQIIPPKGSLTCFAKIYKEPKLAFQLNKVSYLPAH
jgi:hypothetical protein